MKSKFIKNITIGFGGQLIIILLGIIIPRIMILSYGSDVNGLLSTVTQIFSYMALLEAGIGQAAKNALFKPISERNEKEIAVLLSSARSYYRKITVIYAIAVLALSFLVPFVMKTNVDKITVFMIVFFEGMSGVVTFFFIETPVVMLDADGRGYVNNTINLVNKVLGYVVKIVMASCGIGISFLQLVYFLITVCKVFVYKYYFKKRYSWVKFDKEIKKIKLKDRNSYVITEIAWTIFSSTDMIVLSAFVSTQLSSVYSVYNMVFSYLNLLLFAVYNSVVYLLGQTFHEDIKKYEKVHDAYTSMFLGGMTILTSIAYTLCIPFISLYTQGVTDINYINTSLPLLFSLVQLISWSRYVAGNLTGVAGYAKETSIVSIIEAFTNVALSMLLVYKFGIIGVLLATVIALPLKVLWCIYIADRKVMKRNYGKTIRIFAVNYGLFFITVICNRYLSLDIYSYGSFFVWALIIGMVIGSVGIVINLLTNTYCLKIVKGIIQNKISRK